MNSKFHWLGIAAAAVTALVWGLQAIVLKIAVKSIDPMTISWFRFFFSATTLFTILFFYQPASLKILRKPPLGTLIAGLFLAINYFLFLVGLDLTAPGNAQVMIQAAPFGFALYAIIFLGEKISKVNIIGFLITPIGFLLFFHEQVTASNTAHAYALGNLLILLSALAWIVYTVFQKKLSRILLPNQILLIVYLTATILLLPFAHPKQMLVWNQSDWLVMIILGIFTLIAYGALGLALVRAPASQVSIIITANPLLTIFIMDYMSATGSNLVAPEKIQPLGYVGAFVVIIGVILAITSFGKKTKI